MFNRECLVQKVKSWIKRHVALFLESLINAGFNEKLIDLSTIIIFKFNLFEKKNFFNSKRLLIFVPFFMIYPLELSFFSLSTDKLFCMFEKEVFSLFT